jgi:hypothetical protein
MDLIITPHPPDPADYPYTSAPDDYVSESFATDFEARRRAFFDFIRHNPAPPSPKAPWFELARLASGAQPHEGIFLGALDYIDARQDCADFSLHAILRLLYQYRHHQRISQSVLDRSEESILNFKYWPDEPGIDSMCTWTESHYLLFASAAYLAGQLFPDRTFVNSDLSGAQLMERHRLRLLRWMNLRFFTGFSEWLSHVSYDENLTALLNLVDFCKDEEIRVRAAILIDLILFEMAANNYLGVFGSANGRSYEESKKWVSQESTIDTHKLLFGRGIFSGVDNISAAAFALSTSYRAPRVLYEIANDFGRPELLQRQRAGIRIDQADWWDLQPKDFERGMLLLTYESYLHPRTARLFVKMLDAFDWWENEYFHPFQEKRRLIKSLSALGLLPWAARHYLRDVSRSAREEVNIYTYRTPDYMLSSAQDYRKGYGGEQQHVWQATLGPNAVCFTTHPARRQGNPPNYWSGSGCLPRVAQIKNVVIAIYRLERFPSLTVKEALPFTHAWLPRDQFEEVIEREGWIFARHGDGYLALLSENPYEWRELPGEDQGREIMVQAKRNIWLCELGRRETDGDFSQFVQRILQAEVQFSASHVVYYSPSQGVLEFGWHGQLRQNGREIPLGEYPRYASPYVQAPFPPEQIEIQLKEYNLNLDWLNAQRRTTEFI